MLLNLPAEGLSPNSAMRRGLLQSMMISLSAAAMSRTVSGLVTPLLPEIPCWGGGAPQQAAHLVRTLRLCGRL